MISAVVNTWNEENYIRNCLSTLKWCDEIIVVDMRSTDRTREIAAEFTDQIILHEPMRYVEPARQFAVDQAKGEWILVLDADEMITPELAEVLKKSTQDGGLDILSIPRKNYMFGKWIKTAGWWPGYQIRFFRKGKLSFSDRIHSFPQTIGKVRILPAEERYAIIHFNYTDAANFIERLNRYTSIEAENLVSIPLQMPRVGP
jgi:glycosyltransferase involved in cell wall biosynthesis